MSIVRWALDPNNQVVLKGEPLQVEIKSPSRKETLASFVVVPRGVGEVLQDITFHVDTIVETKEKTRTNVSSTFVQPKTVQEIYDRVIEFVAKFSDDPVCSVLADALREAMQPQTQLVQPLNTEDVTP